MFHFLTLLYNFRCTKNSTRISVKILFLHLYPQNYIFYNSAFHPAFCMTPLFYTMNYGMRLKYLMSGAKISYKGVIEMDLYNSNTQNILQFGNKSIEFEYYSRA